MSHCVLPGIDLYHYFPLLMLATQTAESNCSKSPTIPLIFCLKVMPYLNSFLFYFVIVFVFSVLSQFWWVVSWFLPFRVKLKFFLTFLVRYFWRLFWCFQAIPWFSFQGFWLQRFAQLCLFGKWRISSPVCCFQTIFHHLFNGWFFPCLSL